MDRKELQELLTRVSEGRVTPDEAMLRIKTEPYKDMGFAKLDTHRGIRQGASEVIYGAGKTKEQIRAIAGEMVREREKTVLITRMSREAADYVSEELPLIYDEASRIGIVGELPPKDGKGKIIVATGGTSDIPVAEEAALTAQALGNEVRLIIQFCDPVEYLLTCLCFDGRLVGKDSGDGNSGDPCLIGNILHTDHGNPSFLHAWNHRWFIGHNP